MANSSVPTRRKPRFRERGVVDTLPPTVEVSAKPRVPVPPRVPPAPRGQIQRRVASLPRVTIEQALYLAILVGAAIVRFWDIGSRAMHGDEAVHAWLAWNLYNGTGYQYDPVYHGPLQFPVTALFFFLFGPSNVSGRLMAVLFGIALVGLPYFLRRDLGRVAALVAAAFLAISPAFVYVSRFERDDIFSSFFAFTMAIAILGYVRTHRPRYVYLGAASIALSLAAMENTYITLFVFGSFLLIVLGSQYLAPRPLGASLARLWCLTGDANTIRGAVLLAPLVLLIAAFALTVATGLYIPVPLILALLIVGLVHRQSLLAVTDSGQSDYRLALSSISRTTWINAATMLIAILFLFYSTFGSNLNGIWDAGKAFFNTGTACPSNTFPLNPCRKDIIGGLFYWLSQHKVARGGQPWYYYMLLDGLYEQIAIVFGIAGIVRFLRRPTLVTAFLTYWAILMFGVYSWAGEKFPWLMIHALLPFLLLGAMFIVDVVRSPGFGGWLTIAVLAVLSLLELHNMYEVNFVNGADPVEMMVYVQSSPDTPKVAQAIETISNKVTNGQDLHVTIDSLDTWPFAWYLRNLPNVAYPLATQLLQKPFSTNPVIIVDAADQPSLYPKIVKSYTGHEYKLRWWFPEDYKQWTWPTFFREAVNPGYWRVIAQWQLQRRQFGPKQDVMFYYYVKRGLVSPY